MEVGEGTWINKEAEEKRFALPPNVHHPKGREIDTPEHQYMYTAVHLYVRAAGHR